MGSVIPGRLFGLKMILFGTREDPLQDNKHVNRKMKREAISNIQEREIGRRILKPFTSFLLKK